MHSLLNLFYRGCEYVFPERRGYKLVRSLSLEKLLPFLSPQIREGVVSLLPFNEPSVRALIHEAKFRQNEQAFKLLGEVLATYLKHFEAETIIIPIPLAARRRKERGYNQTEEILKAAMVNLPHLKISYSTLYRDKETKPQTSLSRTERLKNVSGAFACQSRNLQSVNVVVFDDVSTTGATLKSAEAALRTLSPASITLLSLAH